MECNFVKTIEKMQKDEITTTNNYQYMDKVCFNGYLARECFGGVYDFAKGFNGLVLLEEEIGLEKFDRIIAEHIDYIHDNITFEEAKQNVIDILKQ